MSEYAKPDRNYLNDAPRPEDRQALLNDFADRPSDDAIWDTAYAWVLAEGDHPSMTGPGNEIPAIELIAMAQKVRATDQADRYNLVTRTASNGKLWFDVIEGFSLRSIHTTLARSVDSLVRQRQAPFSNLLDVATGTGNTLSALEPYAEHVVGIDRNPSLLSIAKNRSGANTSLVQADITSMPFADDSFDLVAGLGIEGSLDKSSQIAYYSELARVMAPGALYLTAFYNYPEMPSEDMDNLVKSSKATLTDMICDTVSGGINITERLDNVEMDTLLEDLGLHKEYYLDISDNEKSHTLLQAVTKL